MNLKRHHVLYILLAVSLMLALLIFLAPMTPNVSFIPAQTSSVSTSAQERGLGGRTSIPENYGMLFVFKQSSRVGFWMKDMQVPIDIVWLSDNGTIIGIEDSLSPDTYPQAFYPAQPVKLVLETKAGEMRRRGWSVGTKIPLPLPYGN
jgi:uncharacterized membrane protein (UPF0127 family)